MDRYATHRCSETGRFLAGNPGRPPGATNLATRRREEEGADALEERYDGRYDGKSGRRLLHALSCVPGMAYHGWWYGGYTRYESGGVDHPPAALRLTFGETDAVPLLEMLEPLAKLTPGQRLEAAFPSGVRRTYEATPGYRDTLQWRWNHHARKCSGEGPPSGEPRLPPSMAGGERGRPGVHMEEPGRGARAVAVDPAAQRLAEAVRRPG